ncbi:MAG: SDR family oxidoreductase [bacterium]|nr:SDR family oxidoreductase [bacterium]
MADVKTMDLFRLDGRVALITGGSKGLGKEMARGLAEAGATVVICSRNQDACDEVAAELVSESGGKSRGMAADVTVEADVDRLFETVQKEFGRLDVVINSAGINKRHPIEEFPYEEFKQIMDINLAGSWLCCRAAGRVMKPQGSGSVINVGSTLGAVGLAERTAYCASKSAILGLTRTLALEWAPFGVRCNALCPGPFLTEINQPLLKTPEKVESLLKCTAFNRWGELHEIRGTGLFLASDASSYMTGSALYVDGGWTAH